MQWRVLKDFPKYEISEDGQIRRIANGHIRIIYEKNGYKFTQFRKNGKRKNYYIHRLVAETFIERPRPLKNYNYVNHKSLDKHNNHFSNLEWVTQATNIQHYHENKNCGGGSTY